jgi:hypothetical protein
MEFLPEHVAHDFQLAVDAQPGLITTSSAGIPAFMSMYIDPKLIEVLTTPNRAAEILGEVQKGTWVTRTMTFPMVESTGETSSYNDWSENGMSNANVQFPQRQSYHYQTITEWGEKQLAEAGLAKIDWSARLRIASAMALNKFQNLTYFYGVSGLQNYGLLNDPSLSAAITPTTKAVGGGPWASATANEVFADFQKLFAQLVTQSNGLVQTDSRLVLALPPAAMVYLTNTNTFGIGVMDLIKKSFPNLRIVSAPQYTNAGVNTCQLIAEDIEGQETGYCSFTEKMRAHPIIPAVSSFKQKASQGSWGCVIFLPLAIATMTGI